MHGQNELTEEYVRLTSNINQRDRRLFKEKHMILNLVATESELNISMQGEKFRKFERKMFKVSILVII